jgi:hypothetical protein
LPHYLSSLIKQKRWFGVALVVIAQDIPLHLTGMGVPQRLALWLNNRFQQANNLDC